MPDTTALRAAALEQGGVFTVAQARSYGWSETRVEAEIAASAWQRLQPGILVDRAWREGLTPEDRHLVDLRARLGFRGEGWYAARRSALLVHGLPFIGRPPVVPQLVRDKTGPRLRGHNRHERIAPLPAADRLLHPIAVTSVARTVADVARSECFRNGIVVADAALRAGLAPTEVRAVLARSRRWPHVTRAREVLAFADGRSETPLESISRVAFHLLGLPAPEPQVEIWCNGLFVARVDFLWREQRLVGEADGLSKYATVEDFYKEKRRAERLQDLGFEIARWDWAAAYRPGPDLAATIARGLARGALNTLAPGVTLRSTSPALTSAA